LEIVGYQVLDEKVVGEGGFLTIRRLRLRCLRNDGTVSNEGLYDFVERPIGLDAVVLALWHRRSIKEGEEGGAVEVLLRQGLRVPLHFGRLDRNQAPAVPERFTELVAGIIETGEEDEAAIQRRAAAEAFEEAGLTVAPAQVTRLGAATFPTPGMCAERFVLVACEVADPKSAVAPPGDGSPFEEGAHLLWRELDDAIAACVRGEIADMKTEVTLRRLRDALPR
jgi:ADP-ribose pyrophosphatase